MPEKWKYNRVDIYCPTYRQARAFGARRLAVRVARRADTFKGE
jgi:3D (Asp-Asp-Asp) domain-containing protein